MKKLQMSGLAFKTAKEAFRKIYRKQKAQIRAAKRDPNRAGVEPYDLKESFLKKIKRVKHSIQRSIQRMIKRSIECSIKHAIKHSIEHLIEC